MYFLVCIKSAVCLYEDNEVDLLSHLWLFVFDQFQVLELLEVVQFRSPDTTTKLSQIISNVKYDLMVRF